MVQTVTGFGLQDSQQIIGLDVGLVLLAIGRRQLSFIRSLSELCHTVRKAGIALQFGQPSRLFGRQDCKDRSGAAMKCLRCRHDISLPDEAIARQNVNLVRSLALTLNVSGRRAGFFNNPGCWCGRSMVGI
jgi:hypothetical protein